MLINRVSNEESSRAEGHGDGGEAHREGVDSNDYQTARDLFHLMTRDYDSVHNDSLKTRDLVLLYKNIDLSAPLISSVNDLSQRKPNQHVETVIYNQESEDSDISEDYEYVPNVVSINKKRNDLLNSKNSYYNSLCQKFGDLKIQSSRSSMHYYNNFHLKDAIKDQLQALTLLSNSINGQENAPAALLDYICCKLLEDNYNFYMENIIRYVKHTIEQLKRISNGDYLTDKAKKKWREVDHRDSANENKSLVLAKSASIPIHIERKITGNNITWDDIVHSEVDLRSLSKVLEKRIVIEVPKLISGSYELFSKRYSDSLIISCKRDVTSRVNEDQPRVDVFFKLNRSDSGHLVSNISSIMILETTSNVEDNSLPFVEVFPLSYKKQHSVVNEYSKCNVMEITEEVNENRNINVFVPTKTNSADEKKIDIKDHVINLEEDTNNTNLIENNNLSGVTDSYDEDDILKCTGIENTLIDNLSTDDFEVTINKITTLHEESNEDVSFITLNKKKSSFGVRVKSPYENKSYKMDDKKRRKLLEIRERREKKKLAISETCKVTKHKYTRGSVLPQASNSVTKLSITNKSFYNSIYGPPNPVNNKPIRYKWRKDQNRDLIIDVPIEKYEDTSVSIPDNDNKKYINRSYYLDDTVTEMMYMEMHKDNIKENCDEELSLSTSVVSSEIHNDFNILSQFITPSVMDDYNVTETSINVAKKSKESDETSYDRQHFKLSYVAKKVEFANVPVNTPKDITCNNKEILKKSLIPVECRKSIEKIYNLINKNDNVVDTDTTNTNRVERKGSKVNMISHPSSLVQGSESGTSIKHQLTSSNPSNFSFNELQNTDLATKTRKTVSLRPISHSAVEPKVIISTKQSNLKEDDRSRRERKRFNINRTTKVSDNPLKAISQLLHEFDNVQKIRQKSETKTNKKEYDAPDSKTNFNQGSCRKHGRSDAHPKISENPSDKHSEKLSKSKKSKLETKKVQGNEDNQNIAKKKISDLLDEAKETRGEAVRGPSKISRLNSLAQPKKSYVMAHSAEYQTKYGNNLLSDRLQRLAGCNGSRLPPEKSIMSTNLRQKAKKSDPDAAVVAKEPRSSLSPSGRQKLGGYCQVSQGKNSKAPILTANEQSIKKSNAEELFKPGKNMVNEESYVKFHFRKTFAPELNKRSQCKSRVPFLPKDMKLDSIDSSPSAEESNTLGIRLHEIINNMNISNTPSSTQLLNNNYEDNYLSVVKDKEDHKTITLAAIESKKESSLFQNVNEDNQINNLKSESQNVTTLIASGEIKELENALYREMSTGTFQKRLRIKNLTLTPKHSLQQVFVFHSGDTGSMILNRTLSNLKISKSKSMVHGYQSISSIEKIPVLSKAHLDWTFSEIPMQIATVGYALPALHYIPNYSPSNVKLNGTNFLKNESLYSFTKKNVELEDDNFSRQYSEKHNKCSTISITDNNEPHKKSSRKVNEVITDGITLKAMYLSNNLSKTETESIKNFDADLNAKRVIIEESQVDLDKAKENIDYTTSLDMLVGLLNEIQKITTCQTDMTKKCTTPISQEVHQDALKLDKSKNNVACFDERNAILSNKLISMTSLHNLRQLESNPSLYSFYISNNGDNGFKDMGTEIHNIIIPEKKHCSALCCFDKEISVNFNNTFNANLLQPNKPKQNRSTTMSASFLGIICNPSFHSLCSFTEQMNNPNVKLYCEENTMKLTQDIEELNSFNLNVEPPEQIFNCNSYSEENLHYFALDSSSKSSKEQKSIGITVSKTISLALIKQKSYKKNTVLEKKIAVDKYSVNDFNPILKMKRDILVTTYSILVLIVFAALSLPEFMYRL